MLLLTLDEDASTPFHVVRNGANIGSELDEPGGCGRRITDISVWDQRSKVLCE